MEENNASPKPNASWAFEVEKINAWAYWDQAFTPEECQKIIDYANQFKKIDAGVSNKGELNNEIRESKVVWITPDVEINWVYQRMTDIITRLNADYFNFDLFGFTEGFQFTEYNAPPRGNEKRTRNAYCISITYIAPSNTYYRRQTLFISRLDYR